MKNATPLFTVIVVFIAGYVIGKNRKSDKAKPEPLSERKVNAQYKDGKVILSFGDE